MPGVVIKQDTVLGGFTSTTHNRWIDQQQCLVETYRQIRTNLGQLEAEIEAARLRVTNWDRLRRQPSRSRSLSHTSVSTNDGSSVLSCSTDASFLNVTTDSTTTGSSCHSSCSSACGMKVSSNVAAKLSAATLISAFLAGNHKLQQTSDMEKLQIDQSELLISNQFQDPFTNVSKLSTLPSSNNSY